MNKKSINFVTFLLTIVIGLLMNSCLDRNEAVMLQRMNAPQKGGEDLDNYWLKKDFAIALHKAMLNSVELRKFLKDEAIKQFDGDYDVLYNYVKNDIVAGTGKTFREILLPCFNNEEILAEIEAEIPTLTIFVPTLPENSFSAELWDWQKDVPMVAVRILTSNQVPVFNSNEGESFLLANAVPGFPVIVVKENERIYYSGYDGYDLEEGTVFKSGDFEFKFSIKKFQQQIDEDAGERVIEAWEYYGTNWDDGWQRDNVYYKINPDNPNGEFSMMYKEHITSFKMLGDGKTALGHLNPLKNTDLDLAIADPSLIPIVHTNNDFPNLSNFWTDGNFEIEYLVDMGNGNTTHSVIDAPPQDLFDMVYYTSSSAWFGKCYILTSITPKEMQCNVAIDNWPLESSSNRWKYQFMELDYPQTVTNTVSGTSKYNTNFELNVPIKKIGLKFGASAEVTHSYSTVYNISIKSDDLGQFMKNFWEPVIIGEYIDWRGLKRYKFFKTTCGTVFEVTIRPKLAIPI